MPTEKTRECYFCKRELDTEYVDGKTFYGPWAIMCVDCHSKVGVGFGTGKGQRYQQGKKVEG